VKRDGVALTVKLELNRELSCEARAEGSVSAGAKGSKDERGVPEAAMTTFSLGLSPLPLGTFSIYVEA